MSTERQTPAAHGDIASTPSAGALAPEPITAADHRIGDLEAPLQLIEYGDYECPFCGMARNGVADLIRRHGARLLFAFRHFPLVSQHPHAWNAALAAEAAARQGRFFEMHDRLLSNQSRLAYEDLLAHADMLGLDRAVFKRDMADEELADVVRRDANGGVRCGVRGTPTFFVNGRVIEGGYREPEIEAALRAALRSA